jgi:hypothetical protein
MLVVRRHEDDMRTPLRVETAQYVEAAQSSHLNIEQDYVRREPGDFLNGLEAVGRLAGALDSGYPPEQLAHTVAGQALVVDDQDPGGLGLAAAQIRCE